MEHTSKAYRAYRRWYSARVAAVAMPLLLLGCGEQSSLRELCPTSICGVRVINYDWKEDDRLPDGRIVTLTRNQQIVGPGRWGMDNWFTFVHPDTGQTVRWNDNGDRETVALMIANKTVYLLVLAREDLQYHCPSPPYLLYRFDGDTQWTRLPLEQIPIKKFDANMSPGNVSVQSMIKSGDHLPVQKIKSTGPQGERYLIDFKLLDKQSFDPYNCGRSMFNLLISHESEAASGTPSHRGDISK